MFRSGPLAFLALPLSAQKGPLAKRLISALRKQGVEVLSDDDLGTGANLKTQIQTAIRGADVVVADVSDGNSNVLFEVGLAFGMSKPVLLLALDKTEIPPYIRNYQVARYRLDHLDKVEEYIVLWLRDELVRPAS